MTSSAKRPYLSDAPGRFIDASLMRESQFEKPYKTEDYQSMQNEPALPWYLVRIPPLLPNVPIPFSDGLNWDLLLVFLPDWIGPTTLPPLDIGQTMSLVIEGGDPIKTASIRSGEDLVVLRNKLRELTLTPLAAPALNPVSIDLYWQVGEPNDIVYWLFPDTPDFLLTPDVGDYWDPRVVPQEDDFGITLEIFAEEEEEEEEEGYWEPWETGLNEYHEWTNTGTYEWAVVDHQLHIGFTTGGVDGGTLSYDAPVHGVPEGTHIKYVVTTAWAGMFFTARVVVTYTDETGDQTIGDLSTSGTYDVELDSSAIDRIDIVVMAAVGTLSVDMEYLDIYTP